MRFESRLASSHSMMIAVLAAAAGDGGGRRGSGVEAALLSINHYFG